MTDLDAGRIREALLAARELTRAADARRDAAGASSGRLLPGSTRVRARLAEQLTRSGLDVAAAERDLAAGREEGDRRLAEVKAAAVVQSAARAGVIDGLVAAQRAALEAVATTGPATVQYLYLDSPVEIWATEGIDLESSTIKPYDSRAKARLDVSVYHGWQSAVLQGPPELLHFYYLWQNPRDVFTVVTVNGLFALNGFCSAHSRGGVFLGGSARLSLDPSIDLIQTWTDPISSAPFQAGQTQHALGISADSSGFWTDDQTTFALEFRGFHLSYEQALVPPEQYLIIDIALILTPEADNGEVHADFATGQFDVRCPLVWLAILS